MNKKTFALVCLLSFGSTMSAQKTLCLQTLVETEGVGFTTPKRDVIKTNNGVTVTYHFSNVVLEDDPLYNDAKFVNIDGFWPNYNVGSPAVLSRWDTFVVPKSGAKIVVNDSSFVEMPLEISPARPILSNSGNDFYSKVNVLPIKDFRGYFPFSIISDTRNNSYRDRQLFEVCIAPVQYDFVNKKVRIFTKIQYTVLFDDKSFKDSFTKYSSEGIRENNLIDNITLNAPSREKDISVKASESTTECFRNNYLILSVPKYYTAVNRFAEWKKTLGFNVQIALQESWDTTMVKNIVHEAYENDSIEYLLIFGGHNDVPAVIRDRIFNNAHHYHPTDLYYGCINGGYIPDILRGRILVSNENEAMTVVDKIIKYEKDPVNDDFFYNRSLHCAYFQDRNYYNNGVLYQPIDGYEDRRFVLTSERIRNGMLNIIDSVNRAYFTEENIIPTHWNQSSYANGELIPTELTKPIFAWDGDSVGINNCINNKSLYVLMRDHGNTLRWGDPYYDRNNIQNLNNGNYLPVVFSICCLTGKFDINNCFCESFLKQENGGCVAIFGATQSSLSGPNDVMAEGMFDAIWPSLNLRPQFGIINESSYSPTPVPTYRLGQILDQGLRRVDEAYLNTYKAWYPRYTSELFHCFGDPSMMIYTEKPNTFSNASIDRLNNGMISVNTGGVLATISFYNRRTGEVCSYRGYSVTHAGDSETSVCISSHNMIPFLDEGTIYIQNQTLDDGGYYEAKNIKVGYNVTSTRPQGNVNFSHGDYHLVGKQVELNPGTTISVGTTVEIKNK